MNYCLLLCLLLLRVLNCDAMFTDWLGWIDANTQESIVRNERQEFLKKIVADPAANLNIVYKFKHSTSSFPLEFSCMHDAFAPYTKALLERGARINCLPNDDNLFYVCALTNDSIKNLELLGQHAQRQKVNLPSLLSVCNRFGYTPLHKSAERRNGAMIVYLLTLGAPINDMCADKTPLEVLFECSDPCSDETQLRQVHMVMHASDKAGITHRNLMKVKGVIAWNAKSGRLKYAQQYAQMVDTILDARLALLSTMLNELHAVNTCWVNRVPRELVSLLVPFALDASAAITNQFVSAPAQQSPIPLLPHIDLTEGLRLPKSN